MTHSSSRRGTGERRPDGGGPCQVHRRGGRRHEHPGPRSGAPAQRSLRRQARPRAGGGHSRSAADECPRRRVPAGDRPAGPLPGRRRAVRADRAHSGAGADGARPGVSHRLGHALSLRRHPAPRRAAGARRRVSSARARSRHHARVATPARGPSGGRPSRGSERPQRRCSSRDPRRTRRSRGTGTGALGGRAARRRSDHEPARQALVRRVPPVQLRCHGPPGHHGIRLADGELRHSAHRRQQRPVDRVLPAAGTGSGRPGGPRRPTPRQPVSRRGRAHR